MSRFCAEAGRGCDERGSHGWAHRPGMGPQGRAGHGVGVVSWLISARTVVTRGLCRGVVVLGCVCWARQSVVCRGAALGTVLGAAQDTTAHARYRQSCQRDRPALNVL